MKSYRKELWFNAPARMHFTNITPDIRECLAESGIKEGLVLVNAMHITASVFINDDESGLHHDYKEWLEAMPLMSLSVVIVITTQVKIMQMRILNVRLWDAKLLLQ
jgi:thiamine phosphate synthase YjbQ (UPF0047 family)